MGHAGDALCAHWIEWRAHSQAQSMTDRLVRWRVTRSRPGRTPGAPAWPPFRRASCGPVGAALSVACFNR